MLSKIILVTKREYLTRVRKKSFIIMTLAAPLLIVLFYGLIFYFAYNRDLGAGKKEIYVSDASQMFVGKLTNTETIAFTFGAVDEQEAKSFLQDNNYYGILIIPEAKDGSIKKVKLITEDQAALSTVNYIENQLENEIRTNMLRQNGIDASTLAHINGTSVNIQTVKATSSGFKNGSVGASTILGYLGAVIIYLFIFLYGVQIMRGVIEEKTNRIVEVIISSVKPFELMFGKIAGIALVGLTQFSIWVMLIVFLGGSISGMLMPDTSIAAPSTEALNEAQQQAVNSEMGDVLLALSQFNFPLIIGLFVFYFIGGYLFYGALFAAVGSAVDNETDTQQFMLPITMPLIFALVLAQSAITTNPNGSLAFWLSVIPFTSPVVMMVRIPFDVPTWQLLVSMASLILGFVFTTWLAARIYRVGILMYGKKPSYKLLAKWLFSKD